MSLALSYRSDASDGPWLIGRSNFARFSELPVLHHGIFNQLQSLQVRWNGFSDSGGQESTNQRHPNPNRLADTSVGHIAMAAT